MNEETRPLKTGGGRLQTRKSVSLWGLRVSLYVEKKKETDARKKKPSATRGGSLQTRKRAALGA